MNDMVMFQHPMPAKDRRELEARISNITKIAAATKAAMEVQGSVYRFGWFTLMSEANQASFTLQAYQINHPDGLADIAYQEWLADMEAKFNRLYSLLGEKLIQLIEGIPVEARPVGFLEEFANQLYYFIFGDTPPSDPVLDQMRQLEMRAKNALTNTATRHINNLPAYFERAQTQNEEYEYDPQEK